jgi:hypothetical protein
VAGSRTGDVAIEKLAQGFDHEPDPAWIRAGCREATRVCRWSPIQFEHLFESEWEMPDVVDWLADDGLDPAVFESGNHTAMWREIARFEAVLLARLQEWAARNAPAGERLAADQETGEPVARGDWVVHGRGQVSKAPTDRYRIMREVGLRPTSRALRRSSTEPRLP